jgi:hypothetical protein
MSGTGQALDNNSKISEAANFSAVKLFIKPFLPNHQIEGLFNPFIFILFILKLRSKNNMKYPISLSDFVPDLSTSHLLRLLSDTNSPEPCLKKSFRRGKGNPGRKVSSLLL